MLWLINFVFPFIVTILGGIVVAQVNDYIKKQTDRLNRNNLSFKHPPVFGGKIIGRKRDVKALHNKMKKSHEIWITSVGGFGKSTLAIYYAHKYRLSYSNIYWLSWKSDLKKTLTDETNVVSSDKLNKSQLYEKALYHLREEISPRCLLIIDGIDHYSSTDISLINTFRCRLLLTTRTSSLNHIEFPLPDLSDYACYKLFQSNYRKKISKSEFYPVLQKTKKHILTIKLLAKYASRYSIEKMFLYIINQDLKALKYKIEIEDGEPESNIINHLTRIYNISFDDIRKQVLMNLSILPSDDIKIENLKFFLGQDCLESITELQNLGWLIKRTSDTIYLHPVLANTIRQIGNDEKISSTVYWPMLERISKYITFSEDEFDNPNEKEAYIPYCDSILKYYIWEDLYKASLLASSSCLYYLVKTDKYKAIEYSRHALDIYKQYLLSHREDQLVSLRLAHLLTDMSEYYNSIENFSEAISFELYSLELKKKFGDNELDFLKSYSNLMLYNYTSFNKEYLNEAYKIFRTYKNSLNKYRRTSANFYNHFALLHVMVGSYEKAIQYLEMSLMILTDNNAKSHYMYPLIINSLGGTYAFLYQKNQHISDFKAPNKKKVMRAIKHKAIRYLYASYSIKKKNHKTPTSSLGVSAHNLATTLFITGHNFAALYYEKIALSIRENFQNEKLYLASSYLRYGIICTALFKKFSTARFCSDFSPDNFFIAHNIFRKQGINYLLKAQEIYKYYCSKDPQADCSKELKNCQDHLVLLKAK